MVEVSIVAGGAGFIGVTLLKALLENNRRVVVFDNFSNGSRELLSHFEKNENLHVLEIEISEFSQTRRGFEYALALGPLDEVWHLAANSDIPAGVEDPRVDLKNTFLTTFELLRAMREFGTKKFHFASSSAIYGDMGKQRINEGVGPLFPISNYGAMKLASEAQASAAAESFLDAVNLFRFPNVVGVPATHGVILDFVRKLKKDGSKLDVLGDGSQQKAYLHVTDLIKALLMVRDRSSAKSIEAFNVGPVDEGVTVKWIAEQVVRRVSPSAVIQYGHGNKGWIGDVPRFSYATDQIQRLGWKPELDSEAAVKRAIEEIAVQEGF